MIRGSGAGILLVPGSDVRKLGKIPSLGADSVVLDLEDGVPAAKKDEAREAVRTAIDV